MNIVRAHHQSMDGALHDFTHFCQTDYSLLIRVCRGDLHLTQIAFPKILQRSIILLTFIYDSGPILSLSDGATATHYSYEEPPDMYLCRFQEFSVSSQFTILKASNATELHNLIVHAN